MPRAKKIKFWNNGHMYPDEPGESEGGRHSLGTHDEDNRVFHDRLRYIGHRNWRGNVGMYMQSETDGRRYYMFLRDFSRMMQIYDSVQGVVETDWTFVARGTSTGIIPDDMVDWEKQFKHRSDWKQYNWDKAEPAEK